VAEQHRLDADTEARRRRAAAQRARQCPHGVVDVKRLPTAEVDARPQANVVPDDGVPASTHQAAAAQLAAVETRREDATQQRVR